MKRILLLLIVLLIIFGCKKKATNKDIIMVSILPQKYFVKQIAGDDFSVEVLVGPGQSPATYEPLPSQLKSLSKSLAYFRIGVPFENSWIDKIKNSTPNLNIVDTRMGIKLRSLRDHYHHHDSYSQVSNDENIQKDPHIWLSPKLVKIQAKIIYETLAQINPINKSKYKMNYDKFVQKLDELSFEIHNSLKDLTVKKFMVFHPSWGYFADEFGLEQIPIEIEGKEPTPKNLKEFINIAKEEKIKAIFIQSQFSKTSAEAIANEVGAVVIAIDPLSEDYINNLKNISKKIQEAL